MINPFGLTCALVTIFLPLVVALLMKAKPDEGPASDREERGDGA